MRCQGQQPPHHVRRGRALHPVTIGHADVTGRRNARAGSWRARRMGRQGSSGTSRPGRKPGKAGPVITAAPPGTGSRRRQAALIVARGWPGLAAKASRPRGIPVVSRHPGIKRKGLAVSWLTHCRNRLSRRWTIRSRS
jgi:hypothetical protein